MQSFLTFNKTTRKWHLPVVAGLAVGIPLLFGWYFNNMEAGKIASLAGLSILYIQSDQLAERMIILMACCFGFMACYGVGLFFSFNPYVAPFALGLLSFAVHFSLHRLELTKPPGNFFFIILAATAICAPFELESIPTKIGYLALGSIFTCGIALVYSLLTLEKNKINSTPANQLKDKHTNIVESIILGTFIFISLALALSLDLDNPYWMPISCLAVMQGSSSQHTSGRGLQRILGTIIGLGLTWLITLANPTPFVIVVCIILLQVIIEFLIVRNYFITVIFITAMTIFLTDTNIHLSPDGNQVFLARLFDILIGSVIGIIGGWVLYHEKVHYYTKMQLEKIDRKKNDINQ